MFRFKTWKASDFHFQRRYLLYFLLAYFSLQFLLRRFATSETPTIPDYSPETSKSIPFSSHHLSRRARGSSLPATSSFIQSMRQFPWQQLSESFRSKGKNASNIRKIGAQYFSTLLPYLLQPPTLPINHSCQPPPLKLPSGTLPCKTLQNPKRLAALFAHGFDADTLEILFHELDSVVDYFFLLEATSTYYMGIKKPLLWEHLQYQPRFQKFTQKVVYFILDDSIVTQHQSQENTHIPYELQRNQEIHLFFKFLQWNKQNNNYFRSDDLVIFSDLDEIPNRDTVYYLQQCQLPSDVLEIGIWFPCGNLSRILQTDWPLQRHPDPRTGLQFTLAGPTVWKLETLQHRLKNGDYLYNPQLTFFILRGGATHFILGGMHMTDYNYTPFKMTKLLSSIEAVYSAVFGELLEKIQHLHKIFTENSTSHLEALERVSTLLEKPYKVWRNKTISHSEFQQRFPAVYQQTVKFPWFYQCNRERYPSWNNALDPRLF